MSSTQDNSAELITAYLDNELSAEEAERFKQQIAHDPHALSEVEQLRQIMSLVSALPQIHAPPDFCENVFKRVRRRRILPADGMLTLVSLPFQVLSIIIILTVAALNMMIQLEQTPTKLEREAIIGGTGQSSQRPGLPAGPRPVKP